MKAEETGVVDLRSLGSIPPGPWTLPPTVESPLNPPAFGDVQPTRLPRSTIHALIGIAAGVSLVLTLLIGSALALRAHARHLAAATAAAELAAAPAAPMAPPAAAPMLATATPAVSPASPATETAVATPAPTSDAPSVPKPSKGHTKRHAPAWTKSLHSSARTAK